MNSSKEQSAAGLKTSKNRVVTGLILTALRAHTNMGEFLRMSGELSAARSEFLRGVELGRRLGLNIEGAGLPGHFVVRFVPPTGDAQIIDVFEGGQTLSRDQAAAKVRGITGGALLPEHLQAASKKDILVRMLGNLQGLAEEAKDKEALLRYVEALAVIESESVQYRGLRLSRRSGPVGTSTRSIFAVLVL